MAAHRALGIAALLIGCAGSSANAPPCGTTADGGPFVVANAAPSARAIVVDAENVYWIEWGGPSPSFMPTPARGRVLQCSKCGCDRPTVLASAEPIGPSNGIAVDATSVYWTNGDVMKVPIGGGEAKALAVANATGALAVNQTSVFWADSNALMKVAIAGGTPTTVASGSITGIALDAANLYFAGDQRVIKVPLQGGTPTALASGQTPTNLAVDAENAYWTNAVGSGGSSSIMKVPIVGGIPTTLVAGIALPFGMALDATSLYFIDASKVKKVPLAGGAQTTLTTETADLPFAVAVDATSVYWTNSMVSQSPGGPAVFKLTLK
jgi:hypothetical protein